MDKPNRNKTITIKINGNEDAYIKERLKVNKHSQLNSEEEHPVSIESAAAKEKSDESFDWILPSEEVKTFEKESLFVPTKKKSNNRNERIFQRLFVSIVLAVLIGAGFWYIVFKTITASEAPSVGTTAPVNEFNGGEPAGEGEAVGLSSIKLSFVQGGMFTNREAAETEKENMVAKGFPALVVSDEGKYYIALFASDSLENAKAVATTYKDRGMDVYWREVAVAPNAEVKLAASDAEALTASVALYQLLLEASTQLKLGAEQLENSKLEAPLNTLQSTEVTNESVAKMVGALKEAVPIAKTSGASEQESIQIQQHLLRYIALYQQLAQ